MGEGACTAEIVKEYILKLCARLHDAAVLPLAADASRQIAAWHYAYMVDSNMYRAQLLTRFAMRWDAGSQRSCRTSQTPSGPVASMQLATQPACVLHRAKTEEKRVMNALIKEELGVSLKFPSYREGLRAIHAGDVRPFHAM